jgi:hypothetical protein
MGFPAGHWLLTGGRAYGSRLLNGFMPQSRGRSGVRVRIPFSQLGSGRRVAGRSLPCSVLGGLNSLGQLIKDDVHGVVQT